MKLNEDQIKEFAKAYFDQQLQKAASGIPAGDEKDYRGDLSKCFSLRFTRIRVRID